MMDRRFFLTSVGSTALLSGCGARGQFTQAQLGDERRNQPILMATNRRAPQGTERSETLTFFDLEVSVPMARAPGEVPVEGPNAFALNRQTQVFTDADLRRTLGPVGDDPLVIWVHGFNNTAAEAVYRHAQMVTDTNLGGPQITFSWTSAASAGGYLFDRDSALQSRTALEALFVRLDRVWNGDITVIAHSLGCLIAMEALVRRRLRNRPVILDNLILLQPDIAPDVFLTQINDIAPLPQNALLVVSKADPALRISALLSQSANRVGATGDITPFEDAGFRVVDLSDVPDARNPHLVALTSPMVLEFIKDSIAQ